MPEHVPPGGVRLGCGVALLGDTEGDPTRLLFSPVAFRLLRLVLKLSAFDDAGELVSHASLSWLSLQPDIWSEKQTHKSRQSVSVEHLRRIFAVFQKLGLVLRRRNAWGRWGRFPQIDVIRRFVYGILPPSERGCAETNNREERRRRRARRRKPAGRRRPGTPSGGRAAPAAPPESGPAASEPQPGRRLRFDEVPAEVREVARELAAVMREQDEQIKAAEQDPDRRALDHYWRAIHPGLAVRQWELEDLLGRFGVVEYSIPYFLPDWQRHSEFLLPP